VAPVGDRFNLAGDPDVLWRALEREILVELVLAPASRSGSNAC
jgi:hypothetical protein